ncbi:MAG: AraC family transcriptional regulator [Hyphomonadaceae bacterium]|nr:AraC family transcriptional regulator [Hyphomonadaceae bacterium]
MAPVSSNHEATFAAGPLYRSKRFYTDSAEEACSFVSNIFCPHQLRPAEATGIKSFEMKHARFGRSSSLNYLKYGAPVSVVPGEMRDVFNVQLQLGGTTRTVCADSQADIGMGMAGVLSPTCHVSMDWSADSAMLIYSVTREAVEEKLQAILGGYLADPVVFKPVMDLKSEKGSRWARQLSFLQYELEVADDFMASKLAGENFEEGLILALLYSQQHNYTQALTHGLSPAAPVHVKRAEDYIRANAHQNITIDDLADISGVSARTLFEGFKRFRSTSPMKFLRDIRLAKVHEDLMSAGPNVTVTELAMKWGFSQLGRFSGGYKAMFGKTPSETLQEARQLKRYISGHQLQ